MKTHTFRTAMTVGVLATAISGLVQAQASDENAVLQLEEIVVTAQKREQSQQDVPIAITAVSAADIERIGASNVKDIQFSTPNLVVTGSNPVQQTFGIRGISDRGRNPGYDQRVGVYVDGVWVGKSAASNQSALDVQTMEILRGPQGTLFGKNTVAGAISITTKKPTEEFHGSLQVDAGNYDAQKLKASVNVPFSDSLRGKLTFSSETRDGYIDNVASGTSVSKYNEKDEQAVRAQVLWDFSDATEVMFTLDHYESEANDILAGELVGDPVASKVYEVNIDGAGEVAVDGVGGASMQINHSFENGFELTSITTFRYEDWHYADFDEDYSPAPLAWSATETDADHFTQEIRLASPADDKLDYVLGLYYLDQNIEGLGGASVFAQAVNPLAPPVYVGVEYNTEVEVNSWAAFMHFNYELSDQLQLTGGLRYTEESKDIDFSIVDSSGLFTTGDAKDDRSSQNLSPKLSLNWFVSEDVMLYAGYSKAFKSGGYNADFIADVAGLEFDDESVKAYELGMKSTWVDGRLRLNMAVYESNHSDFQVSAATPISGGGSILTISNAGKLTSQGFEMDAQFLATDWLRLWGSYGYTDAKFDEFEGCTINGGFGDCSGNRPAEAPKESYNFGVEVTTPMADGELFANLNYFWRDEMYSNPNNEMAFVNEEYSELSGRIGWTSDAEDWSIYLWGKNLTDETTQIFNSQSFLGASRSVYNPPRMYGVSVSWNFGSL